LAERARDKTQVGVPGPTSQAPPTFTRPTASAAERTSGARRGWATPSGMGRHSLDAVRQPSPVQPRGDRHRRRGATRPADAERCPYRRSRERYAHHPV
jgi:hypothetical protein